jgi:hemoglobin/transferrin/lactoferrin receptor protein
MPFHWGTHRGLPLSALLKYNQPTNQPTNEPTNEPTNQPTNQLTN